MFHHILEFLFGMEPGFLDRPGALHAHFNPHWPLQQYIGAGGWNFMLGALAIGLVVYVYFHEGRSRFAKVLLASVRILLLGFVLLMLNNPVFTLVNPRVEPSVLAVVIDDSISMRVRDAGGTVGNPVSRLQAVEALLTGGDLQLMKELGNKHVLKFYRFDGTGHPLVTVSSKGASQKSGSAAEAKNKKSDSAEQEEPYVAAANAIQGLEPNGNTTQIVTSLRAVFDDLQGQRVAGVVILTDGRDTPAEPLGDSMRALKSYNIKVYPIAVGSDKAPQNIELEGLNIQDSAFKGDIVNAKVTVRATGYEPNHAVKITLKNKKTGLPLLSPEGQPVETTVYLDSEKPQEVEMQFKTAEIGALDVVAEAAPQAGEIDDQDNVRTAQIAVLDAKINVLYVEGYPRWEYRYIKNQMIRDPNVNISCVLLSADPGFVQESSRPEAQLKYFPYKHMPESMEQLMECDVVVFGDVEPRQFTDQQLQLVKDFVSLKGGGFEMIAGPRWSPQAWRDTAIGDILPVTVKDSSGGESGTITQGFHLALTKDGEASSIFRFFPDKARNEKYLHDDIQSIFWYCRGITAKPGVGQVFAFHPTDLGPDGHPAPLLVVGQFGGGRTMFTGIDESWRWRFYTGESIFDSYWVQQFRYLARGKKLGQRKVTLASFRPAYEVGEQVKLTYRVLDATLLPQLPDPLGVDILNADGQVVRHENLVRQDGQKDQYAASFIADHVGKFTARISAMGDIPETDQPLEVIVPRLELQQPQADRTMLSRLASETLGSTFELADAPAKLMAIPTARRTIPEPQDQRLWDAPLALAIFMLLITFEWILRKVYGML